MFRLPQMCRKYGIIIPVNYFILFHPFFSMLNDLFSLHKRKSSMSTLICEEDSIATHYGNNYSSGPLHNGETIQ